MPSLWTPQGERPIQEKDVIPINKQELTAFVWMSDLANKHKIILTCAKCDGSLTGQNTGHERRPRVSCKCREFRFDPTL